MASILPVGSRRRASAAQRAAKSISKTLATKRAAEVWARETEIELDRGGKADASTVTVGELNVRDTSPRAPLVDHVSQVTRHGAKRSRFRA